MEWKEKGKLREKKIEFCLACGKELKTEIEIDYGICPKCWEKEVNYNGT